jgi:hypothetical protein
MKLKFTRKTIFFYIYALLALANLVALFYLWQFANKYVYDSILVDKTELMMYASEKVSDLDEQKFEAIIEYNAKVKSGPVIDNINNPFR